MWIAYIPVNRMGRVNIGPGFVLDNDVRVLFERGATRWTVVPEGDIK